MMKRRQLLELVCPAGLLLFVMLLAGCGEEDPNPGPAPVQMERRFDARAISSPSVGYIDSIFVNAGGDRIYFLHSPLSVNDFLNGSTNDALAPYLPDHTGQDTSVYWNSDLYYVEWDGGAWGAPVNLGGNINSLGNECCIWLNATETTMIFYRDNLGLTVIGETGNYVVTRASTSDPWGAAALLPGDYGGGNQTPGTLYRHDIHMTSS